MKQLFAALCSDAVLFHRTRVCNQVFSLKNQYIGHGPRTSEHVHMFVFQAYQKSSRLELPLYPTIGRQSNDRLWSTNAIITLIHSKLQTLMQCLQTSIVKFFNSTSLIAILTLDTLYGPEHMSSQAKASKTSHLSWVFIDMACSMRKAQRSISFESIPRSCLQPFLCFWSLIVLLVDLYL